MAEEEKVKEKKPKDKSARKAWGKLLRFARPWYLATMIALLFAVAASMLRLFSVSMVENMVDYIIAWVHLGINSHDSVVDVGIRITIIICVMFVVSYIAALIMAQVTQGVARALRRRLSKKINKLPLAYFDKNQTGDVLSRITNDSTTISQTLDYSIVTLMAALTLFIGSAVFMFVTNWLMAAVAVGSTLIGFIFMAAIMSRTQKFFKRQQDELGDMNGHIEEYYGGHTVMKVSNAKGQVGEKFDELNKKLYTSGWKSQFYSGLMMPIMGFISQLSFVAICVVGGVMALNDPSMFAVVAVFMIYVRIFTNQLWDIAEALQNMQMTGAAAARVFDFLGEEELENESELTAQIENLQGHVVFSGVKFGYGDELVIKNFSADIKAGSKVAIVGPTGAGKTTLVNLLMKFYKVNEGEILIDGVSINDLTREQVAEVFGMVLQDTWLFEGTIRENLMYNMEADVDLDEITEAVGINHFIKTLPNGYDTVLDEKASVSDGQRQLLTIARAMIKNSPLLILDEATSSVDTRTEVLIQDAMDKLTENHTSFIIAHRLSTIKNADIILVMNHGDIVESGKHDELLKKGGFYADLYNSQWTEAA
ncbi:MAG: ABC transporter ATP-binding protein/permease [Firmicutes bacterium]|nr:ABC transporter ATP-binding protein/permease [Bacillota bacterium]